MEFLVPSLHNRPKDLDVSESKISKNQGSPFYQYFNDIIIEHDSHLFFTSANSFAGIRTCLNIVSIRFSLVRIFNIYEKQHT